MVIHKRMYFTRSGRQGWMMVVIYTADIQDCDGVKLVLTKLVGRFSRLKWIWADWGYAGLSIDWPRPVGHGALVIVKSSHAVSGFLVLL